ncbi:MAG: RDD family protein [Bryobacteraceae bacterium]
MNPSNTLAIRTPEGIEFALPLAGPFSRMLALVIDLLTIYAILQTLRTILAPLALFGSDLSGALQTVGFFVILIAYGSLTEWFWRGQTLGKRVMGLRVVDSRGLRLEPSQVIVRNLMRFLDALPALYLVGGVACVLNRHRQRLGDIAAGTVVVRSPRIEQPDLDQLLGGKYNSLAAHRHLAARLRQKVTPETARIALEALLRRDELNPAARLEVFAALADCFRRLVPYPPEVAEQISDEPYTRDVVEILYLRSPGSIATGQTRAANVRARTDASA